MELHFFQSLRTGFDKLQVWFLEVGILAVFYYADLFSTLRAIRGFWEAGTLEYMTLNIAVIVAAALWVPCPCVVKATGLFGLLGSCQFLHLALSSYALLVAVIPPDSG